jgi:hypothetical protein
METRRREDDPLIVVPCEGGVQHDGCQPGALLLPAATPDQALPSTSPSTSRCSTRSATPRS